MSFLLPSRSKSNSSIGTSIGSCPICFDPLSSDIVATLCGHVFCWSCLYSWINPSSQNSESDNNNNNNNSSSPQHPPSHTSSSAPSLEGETTSRTYSRMESNDLQDSWKEGGKAGFGASNWNGSFVAVCPVCKAKLAGIKSLIPLYLNNSDKDNPSTPPPKTSPSSPKSTTPPYLHLQSLHSTTLRQRHNTNTLLRTRANSVEVTYDGSLIDGSSASGSGGMSYFEFFNVDGGVSRLLLVLGSILVLCLLLF
ncbi:hypothetical protein TrLO_g1020 [Triparma laevis f. longispina]|uniref:RING-type E3 ubiquitin transferase n=1 Tax=Triparma laevis f. longispina TaxID=1714387 RepID=A0A9W7ECU8_9STRA|nr:hypothetical protein TrLO_g1020 [Triparma laevis f. longispina]